MLTLNMTTTTRDKSDLTFQATLALNTLTCEEQPTVITTRARPLSIKALWSSHQTLLVRIALVIFFILLITLLETLIPEKTGVIARMANALLPDNGTAGHQ